MTAAKYLVRLDDACPEADWRRWDRCERRLDAAGVRPIVAVIPENRDPTFGGPPRADFWDRVRAWRDKGWTIAMHGLHHVYATDLGGLVPINDFSEFAGLPLADQRAKLRRAWQLFQAQGVRPQAWVAPGHSFDRETLRALESETEIDVVSDGIALGPYFEHGFRWLPQQLWRYRRLPFGLWTICVHLDLMRDAEIGALERALARHRETFVAFEDVRWRRRPRGPADRLFAILFFWLYSRRRARAMRSPHVPRSSSPR